MYIISQARMKKERVRRGKTGRKTWEGRNRMETSSRGLRFRKLYGKRRENRRKDKS